MQGNTWKFLAPLHELREGVPQLLSIGKKVFLAVRRGRKVCACGNTCTHRGAPLSEGILVGNEIVCPWHGARFDIGSGRMSSPPALDDIPSYTVQIEGDRVSLGSVREMEHTIPAIDTARVKSTRTQRGRRTFLIAGGGAAGNTAAETLRREGFDGRILVVTEERDLPYDRPALSKELLYEDGRQDTLSLRSEEFYRMMDIELLLGSRIVSVDPSRTSVAMADGKSLSYDALLLATGGTPRTLPVPGVGLEGCFTLRSKTDALALLGACLSAEHAVVIGAGFIGLEAAAALRKRGIGVTVVAPEPVPLAALLGERIGRSIRDMHLWMGVRFLLGRTAARFEGASRVRRVTLSDGTALEADIVLIGVGIQPAIGYLEGSGKKGKENGGKEIVSNGCIPVDGRLRTAIPGIFAAGDIAAVPELRLPATDVPASNAGARLRVEHWAVAERQGRHAAGAMLGSRETYREVPFFWTVQYDASLKYAGYPEAWDRIVFRGEPEEMAFLAGFYRRERLGAVAAVGRPRELFSAAELIKSGVPLSPEQFGDEEVSLEDLLPA